jgi:biopolymer transport protein ExbB
VRKARKIALVFTVVSVLFMGVGMIGSLYAQEAAGGAGDLAPSGEAAATTAAPKQSGSQFFQVLFGSGAIGFILWLALFGSAGGGVYFIVDSYITVSEKRIMPDALIANVTAAMAEGDVLKALQQCETDPGPMANILSAGFSHVEEGFEVIQEAIGSAANFETEKIMQKLTWISVMANLAPMLGLLGTVQGMIMAFQTLATGAPDVGSLALAISQALWTTAAGLCVAVPCVTAYYILRNKANRIILKMESITMELIKDLRNVEVVQE